MTLVIETYRAGEWRKLTTYLCYPSREGAMKEAILGMASWGAYLHDPLRLVERAGRYGNAYEAILGARS